MTDSGETASDLQEKSGSLTQIDLAQPETDPKETASLKHIAESCERHLHKLLQAEEAQEDIVKAKEGHWASRQYAEFNLWCSKVGVHGEGLRSVDVRLKDVPEICNLLRRLLQSLERDLNELEQSAEPCEQIISTDDDDNDDEDDAESDASSLSFEALSSAEHSEAGSAPETPALSLRKQNLELQAHIEDTIDRLHGHALRIEDAGASHRRRRVELYRQKEGPSGAYDGFKALALHKAKLQFKKASEPFLERLAESFARRRIRLEYLREHQKKRTVDTPKPEQTPAPKSQAEAEIQVVEGKKAPESKRNVTAPSRPQDQRTEYSGTVGTKLEPRPQPKRPQKAESVASVALRNPDFPPPPRCTNASFQCPYCRLEFRSREAEKGCWSQHVMQDFEPYFCIWEGCNAPFDVPNTFEGLLSHLQSHVDVQYHVDMPDGEHKTFDEEGFEAHVAQHGNVSEEMLTMMKEASRRKAAFIFESCPFCGGFPDDVEKRFPDRDTPECQRELRKHIKQHMQDVALFLPPFREDIFDEDEDLKSSAVSRRRSAGQSTVGDPSEFVDRCLREDCECKRLSLYDDLLGAIPDEPPTVATLWAEIFPDLPRYDPSPVQDDYYLGEEKLQSFVARATLSDEVEDEVKEGVWGYLFPLDTRYGGRCVVLRKRSTCPLPSRDAKEGLPSGGYLIGRHPECDIVVDDPIVSNRHCLIFAEDKGNDIIVILEDLSSNGTFVNEAIVGRNQRRELQEHDEIAVQDKARFIFRYPKSRSTSAFSQQYTIIEKLGKGHFKEVFVCVEKSTGQRYTVKVFSKTPGMEERSKTEGLQLEIAVLMGISHPNILRLKDIFNERNAVYLVFELAPEGELFNLIVRKQKLTENEARKLFIQLFNGIKYLHDRGIVHRNIQPENILFVDKDLHVKLADFGLAKIIGEESFTTTLYGTPSYVAPEILADSRNRRYTKAVDIWSLGVVLYTCLCGFPPFSDELTSESFPYTLSQQIRKGIFHYPSPYWDSVGDPALHLIDQMLVVDPAKRYTIDQCLAHPWITQSQPSVNDSTDGFVGGLAGLEVNRRGGQGTDAFRLDKFSASNTTPGEWPLKNQEPVKIFKKNPHDEASGAGPSGRPSREEKPADKRNPEEFMELGGKGDPPLFANDSNSN